MLETNNLHAQFSGRYEHDQEYIIKEKRVSNFAIANVECMRKVT